MKRGYLGFSCGVRNPVSVGVAFEIVILSFGRNPVSWVWLVLGRNAMAQ
ncbi:hypothetical protein [Brunnivagina elsteri]|nr:hypothetical protein [Calothrix elsteri]